MSPSPRGGEPGSPFPAERPLAIIVARTGQLPRGGDEAVAEAGGLALVVGSGAEEAADSLSAAEQAWWCDTGPGLGVGALASALAQTVNAVPLVIVPASPDGRDLAPRLAAALDRPLLASAVQVTMDDSSAGTMAQLSRLDDRVLIPVRVEGPAVATLVPGVRTVTPVAAVKPSQPVVLADPVGTVLDPEVLEVLEPDPATMDLSEAQRVLAGGAGLVAGAGGDAGAHALFELVGLVAGALGGSAGATRVATDAGWIGYERQIGTTGVTIDPDLYIALGVSGATQHTGGIGAPRHIVSVNTDPSCPMTAMADLGLVTDAAGLLVELARRFDLPVPNEVPNA
ncbi:MAG TPA: mycofactocin-associated electron transfer flavoprotein alpha subunit [Acidimicrobiales bacterium]|nr:mycofactocin-associated electron transfer flavoprotein alpha subunit [Acidimicrobiales bacterium]